MRRIHQQRVVVRAIFGFYLAALCDGSAQQPETGKPEAPAAPELVPDPTKRLIPPPPIPVTKDSPNTESPDTAVPGSAAKPKTPAPVIKDTGAPGTLPPPSPVPRLSGPLVPEWPVKKPETPRTPSPTVILPKEEPAPSSDPLKKTATTAVTTARAPRTATPSTASPAPTPVAPKKSVSKPKVAPRPVAKVPAASPSPVKADKSPASEPKKSPGFFAMLLSKLKIADRQSTRLPTTGKEVASERDRDAKAKKPKVPVVESMPKESEGTSFAAVAESEGAFLYRFYEGSMIQLRLAPGEVVQVTGPAEGDRKPVRTARGASGYMNSAALRDARSGEASGFAMLETRG